MFLFWRIRYLDTRDRDFKDRDLYLETDSLDPVMRAAVEATHALKESGGEREMLRFRHLFQERKLDDQIFKNLLNKHGGLGTVCLTDYFEDETGREINNKEMAVALTGNPTAVMFPSHFKQHDIDFTLAEKPPISVEHLSITPEQLRVLGYFTRDLRELRASAVCRNGPGTIGSAGGGSWTLKTACTEEEIRSFVMIFRRLYMKEEPANFATAVKVCGEILHGHPLGKWLGAVADEYIGELDQPPEHPGLCPQGGITFTCKRLIDVSLYTRYAHQPDDRRARQFHDCLAAVGGDNAVLTWLFLTETWKLALQMGSAGRVVANLYDAYCQKKATTGNILASVESDHPGIGTLEKKDAREARVLREKAEELAKVMWEEAGHPVEGHTQFLQVALEELQAAIGRGGNRA